MKWDGLNWSVPDPQTCDVVGCQIIATVGAFSDVTTDAATFESAQTVLPDGSCRLSWTRQPLDGVAAFQIEGQAKDGVWRPLATIPALRETNALRMDGAARAYRIRVLLLDGGIGDR